MKKAIAILLSTIFCFMLTMAYAEDTSTNFDQSIDDYSKIIPNYEEMTEKRVLIGTNRDNIDVYEFENQNFIYDFSGYYRLMTPNEVLTEMDRRGIKYLNTMYTKVNIASFYVVTLIDNSSYGLEILSTYDNQEFISESSFRKLCQYYFGFEYDYSGI